MGIKSKELIKSIKPKTDSKIKIKNSKKLIFWFIKLHQIGVKDNNNIKEKISFKYFELLSKKNKKLVENPINFWLKHNKNKQININKTW